MILPVFARVFAPVVVVVPRVVVHVGAAVPAVRAIVVVVVHCGADRDAGSETNHRGRRCVGAAVFFDHDRVRSRGCRGVDDRRVVLRHVNHLRIGRLDHDDLLSRRGGPGRDALLRRAFQRADVARLRAQLLNAREYSGPIGDEQLPDERGPFELRRHAADHRREQRQRNEARFEAGQHGGVLEVAAFHLLVRSEPFIQLRDGRGITGAQEDLREKLIGIQRDWRHEAVDVVRRLWGPVRRCGVRQGRRPRATGRILAELECDRPQHYKGDDERDTRAHVPAFRIRSTRSRVRTIVPAGRGAARRPL